MISIYVHAHTILGFFMSRKCLTTLILCSLPAPKKGSSRSYGNRHKQRYQIPKNSGEAIYGIILGALQGYPISPDFGLRLCTLLFWGYLEYRVSHKN